MIGLKRSLLTVPTKNNRCLLPRATVTGTIMTVVHGQIRWQLNVHQNSDFMGLSQPQLGLSLRAHFQTLISLMNNESKGSSRNSLPRLIWCQQILFSWVSVYSLGLVSSHTSTHMIVFGPCEGQLSRKETPQFIRSRTKDHRLFHSEGPQYKWFKYFIGLESTFGLCS